MANSSNETGTGTGPRAQGWVPVPDPTLLTTQQLIREIAALKELFVTRLDGNDKAIALLQAQADRQPSISVVDTTLKDLRAIMEEKFKGVDQQFAGRDTALSAALLAQKASVDDQNKANALSAAKAEAGTTKEIDSIKLLLNAQNNALDEKISDVKDRLTAIEAHSKGGSDLLGWIFGGVGFVATVVSLFFVFSKLQ